MKLKNLFLIVIIAAAGVSCGTFDPNMGFYTKSERRTVSLSPDIVRLELDIDDFENLGSTEISIIRREYLGGLFSRIDSINDQPYNPRDIKEVKLIGLSDLKLKQGAEKAAYKVG